jgi:hypothetical protein
MLKDLGSQKPEDSEWVDPCELGSTSGLRCGLRKDSLPMALTMMRLLEVCKFNTTSGSECSKGAGKHQMETKPICT